MSRRVLLDTGPLVALLNRKDAHHGWATTQWASLRPPLLTCEPVLTEACFLLRSSPPGREAVLEMVRRGIVSVPFRLEEHVEPVARLLAKYADVPMSLADACLLRMCELETDSEVMTVVGGFRVYRKHGRQVVPLVMPPIER